MSKVHGNQIFYLFKQKQEPETESSGQFSQNPIMIRIARRSWCDNGLEALFRTTMV